VVACLRYRRLALFFNGEGGGAHASMFRSPRASWDGGGESDSDEDEDGRSPLTGDGDPRPRRRSEAFSAARAKRVAEARDEVEEAIGKVEKLRIETDTDALYANFLRSMMENSLTYPNPTGATKCVLLFDTVHNILKHKLPSLAVDPETWNTFLTQMGASAEVAEEFDAMLDRLAAVLFGDDACAAAPKRPADADLYELAPKRKATSAATGSPYDTELQSDVQFYVRVIKEAYGGELFAMVLIPMLVYLLYVVKRFVRVESINWRELAKEAVIVALLAVSMHFTLQTGQAFDAFSKGVQRDASLLIGLTPTTDPWLAWHPTSAQIRRALTVLGDWETQVDAPVRAGRAAACGITDWTPENVMEKLALLFDLNKNALGGTTYAGCKRAMDNLPLFSTLAATLDTGQGNAELAQHKSELVEHIRAVQADPNGFLATERYGGHARIGAALLGLFFYGHTAADYKRRQRAAGLGEAFDHLSVVEHVFARHGGRRA
jgi:hypothetical protein